ncbi:uncharacterized protein YALI1_F14150g [Yarrowia lipolytica]|uniref:Uncharacterized protein n=1 Tax=Yarrowia lipolytica TaxID=4952 RepID=A0A1D8NMW0_YARLL|nr:hypothetical protein YALI1_F14150g [Yarrowia lipolytica]
MTCFIFYSVYSGSSFAIFYFCSFFVFFQLFFSFSFFRLPFADCKNEIQLYIQYIHGCSRNKKKKSIAKIRKLARIRNPEKSEKIRNKAIRAAIFRSAGFHVVSSVLAVSLIISTSSYTPPSHLQGYIPVTAADREQRTFHMSCITVTGHPEKMTGDRRTKIAAIDGNEQRQAQRDNAFV